jgi:hypothetical protein
MIFLESFIFHGVHKNDRFTEHFLLSYPNPFFILTSSTKN